MIHIYALHQRNHLPSFLFYSFYMGGLPSCNSQAVQIILPHRQLLSGWLAFLAIMGHCIVSINCLYYRDAFRKEKVTEKQKLRVFNSLISKTRAFFLK